MKKRPRRGLIPKSDYAKRSEKQIKLKIIMKESQRSTVLQSCAVWESNMKSFRVYSLSDKHVENFRLLFSLGT